MKLGILGGSGLYQMPALAGLHRHAQETPWGWPSDALVEGEIEGLPVVFLSRHAPGHRHMPSEINFRANVAALKERGCTALVSLAACGSFTDDLPPGALAVPHQIVDRTQGRVRSFLGNGIVAHVSLADPVSAELAGRIAGAAAGLDLPCVEGGTYLCIEGPQFATRAESRLAKAQGMDVVGMTAMPEAALAREAEMAYAIAAFVTDFDAWKPHAVTTAAVLEVMAANAGNSWALVKALCRSLAGQPLALPSAEGWETALDSAIITPRSAWPTEAAARLRQLAPRLFR
jgi:5'-methylthioadenosine phosphorylase